MIVFKKGQVVAGKKIIWKGVVTTPRGGRQTAYRFKCDCGNELQVNQPTITKAANGMCKLRCHDCQKADKLKSNCARGVEAAKRERPYHSAKGGITPETLKRLAELRAALRVAVGVIVDVHVKACHKQGFEPEYMDRVVIEAIEIAQLEERNPVTAVEQVTYEPTRIYNQYAPPKDLAA